MKRRNFLKLAGLAGLGLAAPTVGGRAHAQGESYNGPYYFFITASGGWDPRLMFDPTLDPEQNRKYTNVGSVGPYQYADYPLDLSTMNLEVGQGYEAYLMTPGEFLTRHGGRMVLINGLDTATNNHDAGRRTMMSGSIPGNYPALGALLAAARAPAQPIPFMSGGGYDATGGLVPLARVNNASSLRKVAFPNVINPADADSASYHLSSTMNRIRAAQADRLAAMREGQFLPRLNRSMNVLELARASDFQLSRLAIPDELVDLPGALNDLERMLQQTQLAIAGFQSGIAVSASLSLGGFDTHGNHDRDQTRQIVKLLYGVDYLIQQADAAGLGNNYYVIVGSDFARGPRYNGSNDNAGKDHWPVTSMFALGPQIAGNRVIGGTTSDQRARFVDPATMEVADGGVKITPAVVHRSLRRLLGVEGHEVTQQYELGGADLPLFG